jgi:hypothetical protein
MANKNFVALEWGNGKHCSTSEITDIFTRLDKKCVKTTMYY